MEDIDRPIVKAYEPRNPSIKIHIKNPNFSLEVALAAAPHQYQHQEHIELMQYEGSFFTSNQPLFLTPNLCFQNLRCLTLKIVCNLCSLILQTPPLAARRSWRLMTTRSCEFHAFIPFFNFSSCYL